MKCTTAKLVGNGWCLGYFMLTKWQGFTSKTFIRKDPNCLYTVHSIFNAMYHFRSCVSLANYKREEKVSSFGMKLLTSSLQTRMIWRGRDSDNILPKEVPWETILLRLTTWLVSPVVRDSRSRQTCNAIVAGSHPEADRSGITKINPSNMGRGEFGVFHTVDKCVCRDAMPLNKWQKSAAAEQAIITV